MTASTQTTNTQIFAFRSVLVIEPLSFVYKEKETIKTAKK